MIEFLSSYFCALLTFNESNKAFCISLKLIFNCPKAGFIIFNCCPAYIKELDNLFLDIISFTSEIVSP